MQNILTTSLQQLDDTGQVMARRVSTFADTSPVAGDWRNAVLIDTNELTLTMPTLQVRQVFLRNTHVSAKITCKWTPYTGASATILILGPGDGIAFWSQATGATYGVSAVKLTSDTALATYEMFLGG